MSSTASPLLRTDLDGVFRPRSVAIYGISDRTSTRIAENMTVPGVPFYGINPTRSEACGVRCYPTMADCPDVPEMVVLGVGHKFDEAVGKTRIEHALDDVLSVPGVRAIVMPGLGNEAGAEGHAIVERIKHRVQDTDIALVGPNCMGIATPGFPSPWIGTLTENFVAGPVATLVHSGSIGEILVSLGPRIGFRTVVSAGNEIVTDVSDMTAYFADDPDCRVVGLFLEDVRRPRAFEDALRKLAEADKVAIVLKIGTSDMAKAAAKAHTGAIVGPDDRFDAMLRHYNAIRCDDFAVWLEHLEVFSRKRGPVGRRIGAITNSGGEGEYFADMAEKAGIPLQPFPEHLQERLKAEFPNFTHVGNPVDCWAIDDYPVVFSRTLELMAESGDFDVIVSANDHSHWLVGGERQLPTDIAGYLLDATRGTDIFPCVITVTTADPPVEDLTWARQHDIPILKSSLPGLRALAARLNHIRRVPPPRDVELAEPLTGTGALSEYDSAAIAAGYGITFPRMVRCATAEEAVAAAEQIGYPVVVKIDNVAHKAHVDGVALNVHDPVSVRDAAARMGGAVVVAEQIRGGHELLIGATQDEHYGATVSVGIGGGLAEALGLAKTGLAPVDHEGARELVKSFPALDRLLGGEVPPGLIDAIVAVSRMAAEHPEIAEIDINPLLVSPERSIALDCLIVLPSEGASDDE